MELFHSPEPRELPLSPPLPERAAKQNPSPREHTLSVKPRKQIGRLPAPAAPMEHPGQSQSPPDKPPPAPLQTITPPRKTPCLKFPPFPQPQKPRAILLLVLR